MPEVKSRTDTLQALQDQINALPDDDLKKLIKETKALMKTREEEVAKLEEFKAFIAARTRDAEKGTRRKASGFSWHWGTIISFKGTNRKLSGWRDHFRALT